LTTKHQNKGNDVPDRKCAHPPLATFITNMADGDEQKVVYGVSTTDNTSHIKQHAFPAYALYKLRINRYLF